MCAWWIVFGGAGRLGGREGVEVASSTVVREGAGHALSQKGRTCRAVAKDDAG